MHRQDGRQEIDHRTLLAKGVAFAARLVTGCARSRGFAATSIDSLRLRRDQTHDFCAPARDRGHRSCWRIVSSRWAG